MIGLHGIIVSCMAFAAGLIIGLGYRVTTTGGNKWQQYRQYREVTNE